MSLDNIAIIDDDPVTPISQELLLTDEDFPSYFINKSHPDDYKLSDRPIEKELIFHEHRRRILEFFLDALLNWMISCSVL